MKDAQSEATREVNRLHQAAFAGQVDGAFAWGEHTRTWTSRHGSVTIGFDNGGRVTWIGAWQKTRVEPPWQKWWEKITGK